MFNNHADRNLGSSDHQNGLSSFVDGFCDENGPVHCEPRLFDKRPSGVRQFHRASVSVEELEIQVTLDNLDASAQSRLADTEPFF